MNDPVTSLPGLTRGLLLITLEGTPAVLEGLLAGLAPGDARWDARPDPDRFTLREMTAHLADMEPVWHERVRRMAEEVYPRLPDVDPTRRAEEADFAHSDPRESLARFRAGRADLLRLLRGLDEGAWTRPGIVRGLPMRLEVLAVHVAGHDGYHLAQAAQGTGG